MLTRVTVDRSWDETRELQQHLESQLSDYFGAPRAIRTLDRKLCPYTSSFRIDEVDLRFDNGAKLQLVVKHLSREAMLDAARLARPEFLYDPAREMNAYRSILPQGPSGTPARYGAVSDARGGRHWLFLERVDGPQLAFVGAFSMWKRTAAWIGQFHGSFAPTVSRRLARDARLLVYDEEFYWRWLDRARRFVGRTRQGRRFERIARGYGPIVQRLTALPRTLIHGEFYACNILVGRSRKNVRICPVDWEMAALGPGLMDLACLSAGWNPQAQHELAKAYRRATATSHANGRIPAEFFVDLDCCRLHLAIKMLGWSDKWSPPPQHAHDWLAEALAVSDRLVHSHGR